MKTALLLAIILTFTFNAVSQVREAEKIDEFPDVGCEDLLSRSDGLIGILDKNPNSKAFIIFYEGKISSPFYNKDTKKLDTEFIDPRRGEARNKTEAITFYATKWRKVPREKFVIIDGGYDVNYRVEIWIVPNGAEPPKPTPSLSEKDIKFRKGKPYRVRDCEGSYTGI